MLKFFRTIRKKLIEEDNVRKYLLYAVGEILLVVIGILIALQVNNWNEQRKTLNNVNQTIQEIRSNLYQDLNRLESQQQFAEDLINNINILQNKGSTMPLDSLDVRMDMMHRVTSFNPNTLGYEKLAGVDLPTVVPDTLINCISAYYTEFGEGLNNTSFDGLILYSVNQYRNYMIERGFLATGGWIPTQDLYKLRDMLNDPEFKGIMRNSQYNRRIQLFGFAEAKQDISRCLKIIDNHLGNN